MASTPRPSAVIPPPPPEPLKKPRSRGLMDDRRSAQAAAGLVGTNRTGPLGLVSPAATGKTLTGQ